MAFDIPSTVNEAEARSAAATSTDEELDNLTDDDASENVAAGDDDADSADATAEGADDDDAPAEDGRSTHVKRANFDKVNNELRELREWRAAQEAAQSAAPAVDPSLAEWEPVRQEMARMGLSPQQAAAQIADQKRQSEAAAYEQENNQIHAQIAAEGEVDPDVNPGAYNTVFQAKRYAMDLGKQAAWQARHFALQQFPDADDMVIDAFGRDPQQIQAIARHTHERIATVKANLTKEFEAKLATAKEQAVLEYIATQKQKPPAVERGGGNAAPRSAPAAQAHKLGGGFKIPVMKPAGRY